MACGHVRHASGPQNRRLYLLFESLTLVATGKVTRFPIVLVGSWQGDRVRPVNLVVASLSCQT
jgi:hypothetical protein